MYVLLCLVIQVKSQSLSSDVGVGKKVRGQCLVQCSADFSLVLQEASSGKHWCGMKRLSCV